MVDARYEGSKISRNHAVDRVINFALRCRFCCRLPADVKDPLAKRSLVGSGILNCLIKDYKSRRRVHEECTKEFVVVLEFGISGSDAGATRVSVQLICDFSRIKFGD